MKKAINALLLEIKNSFSGKKCWYVSHGGSAGPTFSLALGGKIRRDIPIRNKAHSQDFRQYEGEINLYVWCTWRVDAKDGPLSSSDDSKDNMAIVLNQLHGKRITNMNIDFPCWDLHVQFTGGLKLHVFCDHVPNDPSFDGNWEVWLRQKAIFFGPGSKYEILTRES